MSTANSSRGPGTNSQNQYHSSQLFVTSVPENLTQTDRQAKYQCIQKFKKKIIHFKRKRKRAENCNIEQFDFFLNPEFLVGTWK